MVSYLRSDWIDVDSEQVLVLHLERKFGAERSSRTRPNRDSKGRYTCQSTLVSYSAPLYTHTLNVFHFRPMLNFALTELFERNDQKEEAEAILRTLLEKSYE